MTILSNFKDIYSQFQILTNKSSRNHLKETLSRLTPVSIAILTLLYTIINPSYNSFYLLIIFCSLFPANWIIKHLLVKPIYTLLKRKSLPIIGLGERPPGATSCGFILDNVKSTTFGMPSGHSQFIWTFGTYLIAKIISNWYYKVNSPSPLPPHLLALGYIWIIFSCCLLLSIMLYVSYSRVYIEGCHTIQQVIIGSILGVISGFLIYYYENDGVALLRKIL